MVFFKIPEKSFIYMCKPKNLGQTKAEITFQEVIYEKIYCYRSSGRNDLPGLRRLRLLQQRTCNHTHRQTYRSNYHPCNPAYHAAQHSRSGSQ
jgi:hypothetical protein